MVAFNAPYYTDNNDVNENGSRVTPCVVSRLLVIARETGNKNASYALLEREKCTCLIIPNYLSDPETSVCSLPSS